jgi:hypothetical protein
MTLDYIEETLSECLSEHAPEVHLTAEQLKAIASDLSHGIDVYGEISGEHLLNANRRSHIDREHEQALKRLEREKEFQYQNAVAAIKNALRLRPDDHITIEGDGSVYLHNGRSTKIV